MKSAAEINLRLEGAAARRGPRAASVGRREPHAMTTAEAAEGGRARIEARDDFVVVHQKVALTVFSADDRVQGVAELAIQLAAPCVPCRPTLALCARGLAIDRICVAGRDTLAYTYEAPPAAGEAADGAYRPRRARRALLEAAQQAELLIQIDEALLGGGGGSSEQSPAPTVSVRIEYRIERPRAGIVFHHRRQGGAAVAPFQVYGGSTMGMARYWMPCREQASVPLAGEGGAFHSWDLEFAIECGEGGASSAPIQMASSGVLVRQFVTGTFKMFHFRLDIPTPPHMIAFAGGSFATLPIQAAPFAMAFYPQWVAPAAVAASVEFLSRAFNFANWFLGSEAAATTFPYPSYYLVFLADFCEEGEALDFANVSFLSATGLCDGTIIDAHLVTRRLLAERLASQYFGVRLQPSVYARDQWITLGVATYLAKAMVRIFHGNNDYRYGLRRDLDELAAIEPGREALYDALADCAGQVGVLALLPGDRRWFYLKSYLAITVLEHRLEKGALQRILSHLYHDLCGASEAAATTATTTTTTTATRKQATLAATPTIETRAFFRAVRRISGKDVRSFAEQFIYSAGCPQFSCSFVFNRRRSTIEVDLKQSTPGLPDRKVSGSLLIRVHEVEGVFDHSVHIDDFSHHFELPIHAKAKKIKRKKKATGEAAGEADEEEDAFILPLSWVRLDPEVEWIASLQTHQSEGMLIEQLRNDRDVIAQYEAIVMLQRHPSSLAIVEALEGILNDPKCFHRIRTDAALGMGACAIASDLNVAALKLVSFYTKNFGLQSTSGSIVVPVPRPNSFNSLQMYYIRCAIAPALGAIRVNSGTLMELVGQLILNMMRFNDNASNAYSDNYYIATLIGALERHLEARHALGLPLERMCKDFARELDRYVIVERIQPYYRNVVMVAAIRGWTCLRTLSPPSVQLLLEPTERQIASFMEAGNFLDVRLAALRHWIATHDCVPVSDALCGVLEKFLSPPAACSNSDATALHAAGTCVEARGQRASAGVAMAAACLLGSLSSRDIDRAAASPLSPLNGGVGARPPPSSGVAVEDDPAAGRRLWSLLLGSENLAGVLPHLMHFASLVLPCAPDDEAASLRRSEEERQRLLEEEQQHRLSDAASSLHSAAGGEAIVPPGKRAATSISIRIPIKARTTDHGARHDFSSDEDGSGARAAGGAFPSGEGDEPSDWYAQLAQEDGSHAASEPKVSSVARASSQRHVNGGGLHAHGGSSGSGRGPPPPGTLANGCSPLAGPSLLKGDGRGEAQTVREVLRRVHRSIWDSYDSFPFRYAVDASVAGYYDVIPNPMDLSLMEGRLLGASGGLATFCTDLRTLFENCFYFNQPQSMIFEQAKRLRSHSFKVLRRAFPSHAKAIRALLMGGEDGALMEASLPLATDLVAIAAPPAKKRTAGGSALQGLGSSGRGTEEAGEREGADFGESKRSTRPEEEALAEGSTAQQGKGEPSAAAPLERLKGGGHRAGGRRPLVDRMRAILERLKAHPNAYWFAEPVDPVALNIPEYATIVREPIDFATLEGRLEAGAFTAAAAGGEEGTASSSASFDERRLAREFARQLQLIFANCILFNDAGTIVHQSGLEMQQACTKLLASHLPEAAGQEEEEEEEDVIVGEDEHASVMPSPPPSLPPTARRGELDEEWMAAVGTKAPPVKLKLMLKIPQQQVAAPTAAVLGDDSVAVEADDPPPQSNGSGKKIDVPWTVRARAIIERLGRGRDGAPFRQPVDPVALAIPTYRAIVKEPMDLSTVRARLDEGHYDAFGELDADVRLIFANCLLFNGPDAPVSRSARAIEALYERLSSTAAL